MPTFFNAFGLRFFIYSEEHQPIHIHVQKGRAKAKFIVVPSVEIIENKGLKSQELSLAKSLIEENQKLIIERWNEHLNKLKK